MDEAVSARHERSAARGMGDNGGPRMEAQRELAADLAEFGDDWLGFVLWAFPWGVPGGPLENETGPDVWQAAQLDSISADLKAGKDGPIREATASGHGIGKSALVAWIVICALMTYPDSRGRVTANTDTQLRGTTWAEVSKWFEMLDPLLKELFTYTATSIYSNAKGHEKTWRVDAVPWSKANPAAFAGLHNAGKRVFLIMDEASEIADVIWDTIEGATTDANTEIILCVYGNPTQPTGRFKEVVAGRFSSMWRPRQIDSRTVKRTNKATLAQQIALWGEDSDYARIRIRGMFPRVGMTQLIPSELVTIARKREALYTSADPLIMGVDVARYGNDQSVFAFRRGNDARTIPWQVYSNQDTMFIAAEAAIAAKKYGADAVFVDTGGVGAGVFDRLIQLQLENVYPVDFGSAGGVADYQGTKVKVANKRAAMWVALREWLRIAGAIPDDPELGVRLENALTQVQYSFVRQSEILLESKEHMRSRGLSSPDEGDGLAITFAYPVMPRAIARTHSRDHDGVLLPKNEAVTDYDIHADLN